MARRRWTEDELARLRAGYARLEPAASIAAAIDRNVNQVRLKARDLGIGSKHRMAIIISQRMQAAFADPSSEHAQRFREATRTDAAQAKRTAAIREAFAKPHVRARVAHQRRTEWDAKRGFKVPARQWAAYQHLLRKDFSAQEAGAMLGLIPRNEAAGGL